MFIRLPVDRSFVLDVVLSYQVSTLYERKSVRSDEESFFLSIFLSVATVYLSTPFSIYQSTPLFMNLDLLLDLRSTCLSLDCLSIYLPLYHPPANAHISLSLFTALLGSLESSRCSASLHQDCQENHSFGFLLCRSSSLSWPPESLALNKLSLLRSTSD